MAKVSRYQDLVAWQKAYSLTLAVYRESQRFPPEERFGLQQQMRRAAVSIPSNIAEGFGRHTTADYLRFLDMARGSAYELETQIQLAHNLGYMRQEAIKSEIGDVERLLNALVRSLRRRQTTSLGPEPLGPEPR